MARPKREKLEILKTKSWFAAVAAESGVTDPAMIADFLGDRSGCDDATLWRRYRTGDTSPSARTLNSVERRLPGTKSVYCGGPDGSRLWDALDPNTPIHERNQQIQHQCDEWSSLSDKPTELQRWLDYWPPRHRSLVEIHDEVPEILGDLAKHYPLQTLAIGYQLFYALNAFVGITMTPDILPTLRCIVFLFPIVEARLKHYGITRSELFEIADPLVAIATNQT